MEAAAFVEPDLERLLDTALTFIPADSTIARLIGDVREWHAAAGAARWASLTAHDRHDSVKRCARAHQIIP